ncbi:MAG: serine hydrolase [Lachnospiraceae bacterium]
MDTSQDNRKQLDSRLRPLLKNFSGTAAVAIRSVQGDFSYGYEENRILSTASTAKIFILGALLEQCAGGKASLSEKHTVKKKEIEGGSGVLRFLKPGIVLRIYDLAMLMVIASDNTATNLLIDYVGGPVVVNEHLKRCKIMDSAINRRLSEDPAVMAKSSFAAATARDFTEYLRKMKLGRILPVKYRKIFFGMMSGQLYKDLFLGAIPLLDDEAAETERGVRAANKTGFMPGIRCDVGAVSLENGEEYVYAVLTGDCKDTSSCVENEAGVLIRKIGRAFYECCGQ